MAAVASSSSIRQTFSDFNLDVPSNDKDLVEQAVHLCTKYGVTPAKLGALWEAQSFNDKSYQTVSDTSMMKMEAHLQVGGGTVRRWWWCRWWWLPVHHVCVSGALLAALANALPPMPSPPSRPAPPSPAPPRPTPPRRCEYTWFRARGSSHTPPPLHSLPHTR
jgi:hypothetical protein